MSFEEDSTKDYKEDLFITVATLCLNKDVIKDDVAVVDVRKSFEEIVNKISDISLSKAKVREAIMRLPNDSRRYKLLKELGL